MWVRSDRTRRAVVVPAVPPLLLTLLLPLLLLLGGCSGRDRPAVERQIVEASTPDELAEQGTSATTTAAPGGGTDDVPSTDQDDTASLLAEAGLTPDQVQCVINSGFDGPFETVFLPGPDDPIGLIPESGEGIPVPPRLATGAELDLVLLTNFAATCAPGEALSKVALLTGALADAAAVEVELPLLLERRREQGATQEEVGCLDARFRAAPVRLSSFIAAPTRVELTCMDAGRLGALRGQAYRAGFAQADIPDAAVECLVASPSDRNHLADLMDSLRGGGVSFEPAEGVELLCGTSEDLAEFAVALLAASVEFGGESLRWE